MCVIVQEGGSGLRVRRQSGGGAGRSRWSSSSSSSKSAVGSGTARGSDDVPQAAEKSEQSRAVECRPDLTMFVTTVND